jgi:hypothetical protein
MYGWTFNTSNFDEDFKRGDTLGIYQIENAHLGKEALFAAASFQINKEQRGEE